MSAKSYTLEQLKLADELAFPENMERLLRKHVPNMWFPLYREFMETRSIAKLVFSISRNDPEMRGWIEALIDELLGIPDHESHKYCSVCRECITCNLRPCRDGKAHQE